MKITHSRVAKQAAIKALAKPEYDYDIEEEDEETEEKIEDVIEQNEEIVNEEESTPVFEIFKSNAKLEDGLSIIRSLGGGKYEIVNLSRVHAMAISSGETGRLIKNTPGLMEIMDIDEEDWEVAKFKCGQAVNSANATIFRFQKLPPELRLKIYELTVMSNSKLRLRKDNEGRLGLALLRTCRQIHDEASLVFHKNIFIINEASENILSIKPFLVEHVQEASFEWWGFALKDPATLQIIAACRNLKVLHLVVGRYTVDYLNLHRRRQYSYQDDETIKKFRRTNGFDALCRIRGLERVVVKPSPRKNAPTEVDQEDLHAFEVFLNNELTKPKSIEPRIPTFTTRKIAKAKTKLARKKVRGKAKANIDWDGAFRGR